MSALAVIPARIGSTRLPRKPLVPLLGRPLVEWVWRRVAGFDCFDRVVVATDSTEVVQACEAFGAEAVLTAAEHPSGTHRVAEVRARGPFREYELVMNVQGDEPLVGRGEVEGALRQVRDEGWALGTAAAPLGSETAWRAPSVVKVVRGRDGRALYFSRGPVPWKRDGPPTSAELRGGLFLRHVGIYAYRAESLEEWVRLPPSPLEELEKLEQLRPLEAGIGMGVALVDGTAGGVDTPEDVQAMERRLREPGRARTGDQDGNPVDEAVR